MAFSISNVPAIQAHCLLSLYTDLRDISCEASSASEHDTLLSIMWHHLTPVKAAAQHISEAVFRVALEDTVASCNIALAELHD